MGSSSNNTLLEMVIVIVMIVYVECDHRQLWCGMEALSTAIDLQAR